MTARLISLSSANKALLLSNLGRLMRLCAQGVGGVETKLTGRRGEFSQEERSYFNKVIYCFQWYIFHVVPLACVDQLSLERTVLCAELSEICDWFISRYSDQSRLLRKS